MDIQEIERECGTPNKAGTHAELHLICACDIETFPPYLSAAVVDPAIPTYTEEVTLDGSIDPKSGTAFVKFDVIVDSGEVKDTITGPNGGKSIVSTLDFMLASTDPEVVGAMKCLMNACLVAIIKEKSGHVRVLGNKEIPAKIESGEATTGKTAEDLRGATLQIKSVTGEPAAYYTDVIDVDPLT